MIGRNIKVVLPQPQLAPAHPPTLLRPRSSGDLDIFPDNVTLRRRGHFPHSERPGLRAFVKGVFDAQDRIWILDPFFGQDPIHGDLYEAFVLAAVTDLSFFTRKVPTDLLQSLRKERSVALGTFAGVTWYGGLAADRFPFCHDRFAIVDNELWHFGGTVGGGQPGLTAVSRGWPADVNGAVDFFC